MRIAIDDFGTGYSSLTYLRRFPVDVLKIAKDFIGPGAEDNQGWAFAGAILALGQQLGLRVVAEGVEDEAQLRAPAPDGLRARAGLLLRPARPPRRLAGGAAQQPVGQAAVTGAD